MDFQEAQIALMNETDVRENIIRPFLNRLGYLFDGPARVRTEITLRYPKAFLGRKKATDPGLRGRGDYICEVMSYGRWVIEAKGGSEILSLDDAEQAHTYATHPEIAAFYYLITNGREYRLFANHPQKPILVWTSDEMAEKWSIIENILGPDAIRQKAVIYSVDTSKPLAPGYKSRLNIVGGYLTYDGHRSTNPVLMAEMTKMEGMQGTFTGKEVWRTDNGMIRADVEIRGPYKGWDELNRAAGITGYEFESAVEFVSVDPSKPTIFQGISCGLIKTGQEYQFPGQPLQRTPIGMKMIAATEATGYLANNKFQGVFCIAYTYELDLNQPVDLTLISGPARDEVDRLLKIQPKESVEAIVRSFAQVQLKNQTLETMGTFEMNLQ